MVFKGNINSTGNCIQEDIFGVGPQILSVWEHAHVKMKHAESEKVEIPRSLHP